MAKLSCGAQIKPQVLRHTLRRRETENALKPSLTFFVAISVVSSALAQEAPRPIHQQTTLPASARFEIIQSTLAARLTFRLDRYTGQVWQLVKTRDDDNTWEETPVSGLAKGTQSARPRFQIFTSGFAVRHTFLLDTDTGKTWLIVVSRRKNPDGTEYDQNVWAPFPE